MRKWEVTSGWGRLSMRRVVGSQRTLSRNHGLERTTCAGGSRIGVGEAVPAGILDFGGRVRGRGGVVNGWGADTCTDRALALADSARGAV